LRLWMKERFIGLYFVAQYPEIKYTQHIYT
jgi:hypothetical protein